MFNSIYFYQLILFTVINLAGSANLEKLLPVRTIDGKLSPKLIILLLDG